MDDREAAPACHDFKFGDNQVSDALLARLSELGASAPRLGDTKCRVPWSSASRRRREHGAEDNREGDCVGREEP